VCVCVARVYTSRRRRRPRWLLQYIYIYNIAEGVAATAAEIHAGPHTGYIRIYVYIYTYI